MPIEVDEARRLDEIAAATIQVARERGMRAVTIRAVAEQLGGSTAVITNYVPSRAGLMVNALRHAEEEWNREIEEELQGLEGPERLSALARWMCTTRGDDEVLRRLLMETISAGPAAGKEVERTRSDLARAHSASLDAVVAEAGPGFPPETADILHLLFRGFWLAALEDSEGWPAERGAQAAQAVLDLLGTGASGAADGRVASSDGAGEATEGP
ncbi:TetR/AcrR family transcriptional regulator [Streptomyces sp. NPDC127072]|uniref:TetR/AcrR family transcriptional regulator n=1 Tax=Streptomyces sp. NPDC127072 TaxID=3347129 RepID=UPI003663ECD5